MKKIKTHKFNGVKYDIDLADSIEGVTDNGEIELKPKMLILTGNDFKAFHSAFHEALEASGFCDICMHFKDGNSRTIDAARFLTRWLRKNKYPS